MSKRTYDEMAESRQVLPDLPERDPVIVKGSRAEKVKDFKARQWCLTYNNWTEEGYAALAGLAGAAGNKFILAKEICPKTGTPHIQGWIFFKSDVRASTLRNHNGNIHWTKCTRGKDEQDIQLNNLIYCSKDKNYITNCYIPPELKVLKEEQLYKWQRDIELMILGEPDDRKIYWYFDYEGCKGKTALTKYLANKYDWVEFSSATKSADIITLASPLKKCYILNFTRSQEGYEPWNAIEQLKDGMISDAKLKKRCRNVLMNPPWVICFSNRPPDYNKLSQDRWVVVDLEDDTRPPAHMG